jgi:hypothetical protein
MDLATHQRKLLGLFRTTYKVSADDDPYIHKVAHSKDLVEGRGNIFLWRVFVLERTCALTATLLRQRNILEETLHTFIANNNISPFRETQAPAFLESLRSHPDHLIASVSRFELALMKVREGDLGFYAIAWKLDPHSILNSLAKNLPLKTAAPQGFYQTLVSRKIAGYFEICSAPGKDRDGAD